MLQIKSQIEQLEENLVFLKAQRNIFSENLEDIKYEVIDIKQQLALLNEEAKITDAKMSNLKTKIT